MALAQTSRMKRARQLCTSRLALGKSNLLSCFLITMHLGRRQYLGHGREDSLRYRKMLEYSSGYAKYFSGFKSQECKPLLPKFSQVSFPAVMSRWTTLLWRFSLRMLFSNSMGHLGDNNLEQDENANGRLPVFKEILVYWCVDRPWSDIRETLLSALANSQTLRNDRELYRTLKAEYIKARGGFRHYLTWKSCHSVKFIKVSKSALP